MFRPPPSGAFETRRRPGVAMAALGAALAVAALAGCGGGVRQFAAREIVWSDDTDRRPFRPAPAERELTELWPGIDHMIFRPAAELWAFEPRREALDVNALDEVPDSSWYENRISRRPMSPTEVARGACPAVAIDLPGPWRVVSAKVEGAGKGFVFEAADGARYLLKVDREQQPEQATAGDAIVASIFHAAGYHVPCNRVVGFTPDLLEIDPEAVARRASGGERRLTRQDLDEVVRSAHHLPDGRLRAVVSRFVDGRPLGPWSFMGTRDGDPNDVVPHERRRELRGMFVLAGWTGRWDARDHNTLSSWIEVDPRGGFVRHYVIDFGETLGFVEGPAPRARRFNHSQWLDVQHIVEDALTLGVVHRPWDDPMDGPEVLGNFDVEHFDPDSWRPDYWNGAFERHTERDAAWMARIISRFRRPHLEALVRLGHYSEPEVAQELVRILAGRRRAILERYLTRLSPLTSPRVVTGPRGGRPTLCLTDLAVQSGIREASARSYSARAWGVEPVRPVGDAAVVPGGDELGQVCVRLPERALRSAERYVMIDVVAATAGRERTGPARVHLSWAGSDAARGTRVVGLERPDNGSSPD